MRSLTHDELATLDIHPADKVVLEREFNRQGWVTVLGIHQSSVRSVTRYQPAYFRKLCTEGRLPLTPEDQLVIGLE